MQTSGVLSRNFKEIFSTNARYEIPFFQRGYSWQQKQWKKLILEDILGEDGILDNVNDDNFKDTEHFFGPIVVLEKTGGHPSLKRYQIIDGQQRFTTSYLLLAVIKELIEEKSAMSPNASYYVAELNKMLINTVESDDDYLKLKIFSTKGDRFPTYKALFNSNPVSPFLAQDQHLYDPKTNRIDEFISFANKNLKGKDVPTLWNIARAVFDSLRIVWIPLDEKKDDAQAIFESLNDAGQPLTASELLCNFLFKPLITANEASYEQIHNEKWLSAQRKVGYNNFEEYLRNLFSIGEKKKIGKEKRMYAFLKNKHRHQLDQQLSLDLLDRIVDYTEIYNQIIDPTKSKHPNHKINLLLYSIKKTNMDTVHPYLMALLKAFEKSEMSDVEVVSLLKELYTLLVRRKIAKLQTTKYDVLFPNLFNQIINEGDKVRAFQKRVKEENLWVDDQTFEEAFLSKELYNPRELGFSRHILQEIDIKLQPHGELPDYTTLPTIEHVLPQTLDQHWKIYLGADALDANLPRIINTLGNLSLNSQQANSTWGQKSFSNKQTLYNDSSALARDIKARPEPWNIQAIQKRSADLAQTALKIWNWKL
ncbi:DUF262 domain-containing protein [Algoriphagus yeomjeoni]|uniref:DUF262 domain-containing protein n=1 Tax=Algoriphagus yeomjeoni TaxID=291403 RepID=UPI003CE4F929